MTKDQFERSQLLQKKIEVVNKEIDSWELITHENFWHPVENVPSQLIETFKANCISEIRKRKELLEKEFTEI